MPLLRFHSTELSLDQRRMVARELTDAMARARRLEGPERDWCTVHFMPFAPDEVAIGGTLIADGKVPEFWLELSDHGLGRRDKRRLVKALTGAVVRAFDLPPEERYRISIVFRDYDAGDLAIGGTFVNEMWKQAVEAFYRRVLRRPGPILPDVPTRQDRWA